MTPEVAAFIASKIFNDSRAQRLCSWSATLGMYALACPVVYVIVSWRWWPAVLAAVLGAAVLRFGYLVCKHWPDDEEATSNEAENPSPATSEEPAKWTAEINSGADDGPGNRCQERVEGAMR
ncbi:hypothetical protein [Mycobacteroides abscessus]|uniref:hypothetical protein n=1 Tax=Mycobacteroides abscessus TaxID=36809 RepID=UPI0009A67CF7|nr:hypothetical protein [Mycobacteroides abscessus]